MSTYIGFELEGDRPPASDAGLQSGVSKSRMLADSGLLYHVAYLCVCMLGLVWDLLPLDTSSYGVFWYCLLLVDVVFYNPTLWNVIQSVTRNGRSMLLTSVFAMILIYMFSIVGFMFFRDDFTVEVDPLDGLEGSEGGVREPACATLFMCILTTLNHGLRNGGGVGDVLRRVAQSERLFSTRVVYDLAFFFLMIVIVLNLILGIIIDTFADLRKEKEEHDALLRNTCFICGLERGAFDVRGESFEKHCSSDHHLWSYVNFIVLLKVSVARVCGWHGLLLSFICPHLLGSTVPPSPPLPPRGRRLATHVCRSIVSLTMPRSRIRLVCDWQETLRLPLEGALFSRLPTPAFLAYSSAIDERPNGVHWAGELRARHDHAR